MMIKREGVNMYRILLFILFFSFYLKTSNVIAQAIDCELLAIKASIDGRYIDSSLNRYRIQLSRPPFTAFTTFKLIKKKNIRLGLKKRVNFRLIKGRINGFIIFEKRKGNFYNLRLILFKKRRELLRTLVSVLKGRPFFIAGPSLKNGTLIIGIICR